MPRLLSVLTLNLWANTTSLSDRINHTTKMLLQDKYDIICFQELVLPYLYLTHLSDHYDTITSNDNLSFPYISYLPFIIFCLCLTLVIYFYFSVSYYFHIL
jgi:hypothetical protein